MENKSIIKGTINLEDLPFLRDYGQLKRRLSVRLNNPNRIKPDAIYKPCLDFAVSVHISVSDVVGADSAFCTVTAGLLDYIGVEKERVFTDALENSPKIRPAVTMSIEEYMRGMGAPLIGVESCLMIATVEGLVYGAGVILYRGFLEKIAGGKDLFLIPSSVHEWLYLEDTGECSVEELTGLVRAVDREVVAEEEILSDYVYCWRDGEFRRA